MFSSLRLRRKKNPYHLLEPLLLKDDNTVVEIKQKNPDLDNTGKKYEEIQSPLKTLKSLNPVSYPEISSFGIHQNSADIVPNKYIKTKKGNKFLRGDYLEMMMLSAIKNLDTRVSKIETKLN